jgi:hypothetical protein
MCDYSLMSIPNRLAVAGEDLVTHRFLEGTVGMAPAVDLQTRKERRQAQRSGIWAKLKEFSVLRIQSRPFACRPEPG